MLLNRKDTEFKFGCMQLTALQPHWQSRFNVVAKRRSARCVNRKGDGGEKWGRKGNRIDWKSVLLRFWTRLTAVESIRTTDRISGELSLPGLLTALHCTLCSKKRKPPNFWQWLCQILADFKNSFTDRLSRKFAIQRYVDIPPYLMYVATLPWETWMTEKPTKFTVFQKKQANAFLS